MLYGFIFSTSFNESNNLNSGFRGGKICDSGFFNIINSCFFSPFSLNIQINLSLRFEVGKFRVVTSSILFLFFFQILN